MTNAEHIRSMSTDDLADFLRDWAKAEEYLSQAPEKIFTWLQWESQNPGIDKCPFCGSEARVAETSNTMFPYRVECSECNACTPECRYPLDAIFWWNERFGALNKEEGHEMAN